MEIVPGGHVTLLDDPEGINVKGWEIYALPASALEGQAADFVIMVIKLDSSHGDGA